MDTIFALASAPGKSGVAVIRISGSEVARICASMIAGPEVKSRKATLRSLRDGAGNLLDEALVLRFSEGHSYTGEDVLELHIHGSPAVMSGVLQALSKFPRARQADPGEFTRRALENGRMDLAQVDGLADLINAETDAQKHQAQRLFKGELGEAVQKWRELLIGAAALMQASIDFSDEDIPETLVPEIRAKITEVITSLKKQLSGERAAEIIRDGFEIAIVGAPNIGKSTLLNYLAGREAALTSSVAGTTRDIIEVRMDIAGYPVTFLDTAGIRKASDAVEAMGIEKGVDRALAADMRLVLLSDLEEPTPIPIQPHDIRCIAKVDEPSDENIGISGVTGHGIPELLKRITEYLSKATMGSSLIVRDRHRQSIDRAVESLTAALNDLEDGDANLEIVAEEIRYTISALDSMVGKIGVEDVLDEVFSNFCLGK